MRSDGSLRPPSSCRLGILLADRPDGRRRGEQRGHVVLLDDAPERAGVGRAHGLALVEHGRRADQQRRVDDVGVADHPADVGGRPEDLAGVHVVDVRHAPRERDGVSAVVAHDALRAAGRARRVEDVERIGRVHGHAGGRLRRGDELVPVVVAARLQRGGQLGALQDQAVLRGVLGLVQRGVEQRLVRDRARALEPARGRHDDARPGVVDAHGQLVRREAAEHDGVDRTQARACEHRHQRLRHHRQVEDDPVAAPDAEAPQRAREAGDLVAQLAVGVRPLRARDGAVVDQRRLIAASTVGVAIERVVTRVEPAVGEPARERARVAVECATRRARPSRGRAQPLPRSPRGRRCCARRRRRSGGSARRDDATGSGRYMPVSVSASNTSASAGRRRRTPFVKARRYSASVASSSVPA